MPFTIEGVDNQFAVSTGGNVDAAPNQSRFDNPPQGSKDLRITTKEGDDDPRLFEVGDTYDITWGGQGGGTVFDAVVVRSDTLPDSPGAGVVVFEGVDENGDTAHIIWTPDFDLEQWYADNYNPSNEPQFYTNDADPNYSHSYICFASDTRIKTPQGLKPAGSLNAGDLVTTKDAGDVSVIWVGQRICAAKGDNAPVVFDRGAMENTAPVRLSQQHRVLITSPFVQYFFGLDDVFVPAKACVNNDDIRIEEQARICYVHILLEKHHVLWAEGLECESLFLGDQAMKHLVGSFALPETEGGNGVADNHHSTARPVLKMTEARLLMQHVHGRTAGARRPLHALARTPLHQSL